MCGISCEIRSSAPRGSSRPSACGKRAERGATEIAIYSDPAPYCLPPVDLFHWRLMLIDPGTAPPPSSDLLIRPIDEIPKAMRR